MKRSPFHIPLWQVVRMKFTHLERNWGTLVCYVQSCFPTARESHFYFIFYVRQTEELLRGYFYSWCEYAITCLGFFSKLFSCLWCATSPDMHPQADWDRIRWRGERSLEAWQQSLCQGLCELSEQKFFFLSFQLAPIVITTSTRMMKMTPLKTNQWKYASFRLALPDSAR